MTERSIQIDKVLNSEIIELQHISKQTFYETFAAVNTAENMEKYLTEGYSLTKLTSEINDPNVGFYFAKSDQEIMGYLKINSGQAQTELRDENALEIERIYVLKQFQGQAVGKALFEKSLQLAREAGVEFLWLGVWEENHRALAFYRKNGFTEFGKHLFKLGEDEQTDLMMKLDL